VAKRKRVVTRVETWIAMIVAFLWLTACNPNQQVVLSGVTLRQDPDVRKQVPIANAQISATSARATVSATSDATGLFRLTLPADPLRRGVALSVAHPGFQPVEVTVKTPGELVVVRMPSSAPPMTARERREETVIANVRIRYSAKSTRTTDIGSFSDTFQVNNKANVPCNDVPPCSLDNRWKASIGSYSRDAGAGNEFRNIRLSCIAGPCPFTHIESEAPLESGRMLKVSVRDWSDTALFLLEAEVSQTRMSDIVRQSYPAIFGSTMSFTLPQGSEGPSIEAELNGHDIVFPLGPDLIVSWANCTANSLPDQGNLYRCELKAGYQFR
jgi:hypothetical protein